MSDVKVYDLPVRYEKDNGLVVFDLEELPIPGGFVIVERNLISLPPGEAGGNHRHPRREAFIAFGSLEIRWKSHNGHQNEKMMDAGGTPRLFLVDPNIPHVIVNTSDETAFLIEFADGPQVNVQRADFVV